MVSSKVVVYNPRRWSSGIVSTMPATEELRALHAEIWSMSRTIDMSLADLDRAVENWITTDQRLRLSLSPEGKVLIHHHGVRPQILDLRDEESFAKENPFFWQISVERTADRIKRIEVLFRGCIGPDALLAAALFGASETEHFNIFSHVP
ncbi:MAG: hypothetical protein EOP07_06480, partial [Proteobacteria bacterium]